MIALSGGLTARVTHYRLKYPLVQAKGKKTPTPNLKKEYMSTLRSYHELRVEGFDLSRLSIGGGATTVEIGRVPDGGKLADFVPIITEWSICRPDENFNRRLGRQAALGRALKRLEETAHESEQMVH